MLLILFPYKFTSFHNELLEMQILKKNLRKKILIHDISEIVNKGWNKDFKTKQHAKVTKFKNLSQWKKNFDKLEKNGKFNEVKDEFEAIAGIVDLAGSWKEVQ